MRDAETVRKCETCTADFISWFCLKKKFCSRQCYWGSLKGKPSKIKGRKCSPEHIEKNRIGHLGQVPWHKGRKNPYSLEIITRMVKNRINRTAWHKGKKVPQVGGANHYLWIADRTKLKDDHKDRGGQLHREWSLQVKSRDNWKCRITNQDCNGRMEAHHILNWKDYPELRYQLNNGITLCHFHHPRKRIDEERYVKAFQELVTAKEQ